jgi:hypothetical protein
MSVFQISRIQHRRGTSGELPDALADGEIGMTTDTGEIFFGAPDHPSVSGRRSYPYQNIKILTELDVRYGIKGDVYYHGALASAKLLASTNQQMISCIPLFAHGARDFAVYEFGLSANNETTKAIGEIAVCVHPSDPDQSSVKVTIKNSLNFNNDALAALSFKVTRASETGQDNGVTWLALRTGTAIDFTLTVAGREWSTPAI